jgi:hypothetical protein
MAPSIATDTQGSMDTQMATFSDKLSVNGVPARRSKGSKMSGGIAAHASSDMFKSPVTAPMPGQGDSCTNLDLGIWEAKSQAMGSYVRSEPSIMQEDAIAKR